MARDTPAPAASGGAKRPSAASKGAPDAPEVQTPRDAFAAAIEAFLVRVAQTDFGKTAGPSRIGIILAMRFANRAMFARDGILWAWPSVGRMAEAAAMFRGGVTRAIEALEAHGLIEVDRSRRNHRYALRHAVLATGDDPTGKIVLGIVSNCGSENVLTAEDDQKAEIVLTQEDASSSVVRTDLTEQRPEQGAGRYRDPAPDLLEGSDTVEDPDHDAAGNGVGARERAPAATTDQASHPETSCPDPASEQDPDGQPVTLDDLDRLAAEEREAARRDDALAQAAAVLRAVHGNDLRDVTEFAQDLFAGFVHADIDAADRAAYLSASLLSEAGKLRAPKVWRAHVEAMQILAEAHGGPDAAARAVRDLHAAVGRAGNEIMAERRRAAAASSNDATKGDVDAL